ncbi:MAG: MmgE/PrpD family protein [Rhodospirillaceae bacterium]
MTSSTEALYATLCALPERPLRAQGARLVQEVWSRLPKGGSTFAGSSRGSAGRLAAMDASEGLLAVETAAFSNAFRYAGLLCETGSPAHSAAKRACVGAAVFAASALAEARGLECGTLFHAVGVAIEAYARLAEELCSGARSRGFDAGVISTTLAAIIACAVIEKLQPDKAAQALGLGSSAVTASAVGYLPLQIATAARDGVVMALLMSCGFRGPPDALACRWGIHEVFTDGNATDVAARGAKPRNAEVAGDVLCLFGEAHAATEASPDSLASMPVSVFLKEVAQ